MSLLNFFDPETGAPYAVIDATAITTMRTGLLVMAAACAQSVQVIVTGEILFCKIFLPEQGAEQYYPAPGEGKGRHAGQQDRLYRRNGRKANGTEKDDESGYQHDQQRDFFFSGIWGSKKNFC